ncbi:MAG: YeeE/YedE family protein [Ignavibacteria bacterium]|nr:YeeE/YedE family protein [Ignavibacteria bacterium]
MAPLVPDLIGNELNYVIAIFIGIAFGFILEQAGFSTSKKLVGLFYGYDFTVLRVFFTAGVVAMLGVIILGHFGMLDLSLIYINPTFLWSAIVGGLIMGLGFIIGGFCPGTSVCAAAIGKIDAMLFILGSLLGVYVFAEGYPIWEGLYKGANWGGVRMFETLGVSQALFAFALTTVAVGAFWAVRFVENKVNKITGYKVSNQKVYLGLSAFALLFGLATFALPEKREAVMKNADKADVSAGIAGMEMTADELAYRLLDQDARVFIYDLRTKKEFDYLSLPNSTNISVQSLFEKDTRKQLLVKNRINVFMADDDVLAGKAVYVAKELGYTGLRYLTGGFNGFNRNILQYKTPALAATGVLTDSLRFRQTASAQLPELIREYKAKHAGSAKKASKRVLGGC